jgi:hypothetical protein
MKTVVTALLSVALIAGLASAADADNTKKRRYSDDGKYHGYRSPSSIAERQRHKSTFDETEYYERDSNKIPLGTAAWVAPEGTREHEPIARRAPSPSCAQPSPATQASASPSSAS